MSGPQIFSQPIPKETIQRLIDEEFGDMVKFVVDLNRRLICAGGGLHSDEEQMLLDDGSSQTDLWGANFYPERLPEDRIEYTSMINIRPQEGNLKQEIASTTIRGRVEEMARHYFGAMG
jgi:Protein of unknown function (DUF5674)